VHHFRLIFKYLWLAFILVLPTLVPAQEALRYSLAGDAAIEARRRQQESQPYTIKSGDFRLLLRPSLGLDWNDSVNLRANNAQSDFILRPLLGVVASYPITKGNLLRLDIGVGYDKYFAHDEYSGFRVQSGSELTFDTYIKDFWINLHDRVHYTQDSAGVSAVAGTARYGGLENTAGFSTTWDLNRPILTLGYDHQNFISSSSQFEYINRASELIVARAGLRLNPRLTTGIEGTVSLTAYDQQILNNNTGYSIGAYADWQPGPYLRIQPRAGYTIYNFEQTSLFIQAVDMNAWYAGVTLSHNITETLSYNVSAGREMRLGIRADSIEDWYLRPSMNWKIMKDWRIRTNFFYEHGTQGAGKSAGNFVETYDWLGGGLGIGYSPMKRLNLDLHYRYTHRAADVGGRNYAQNLVGLMLTYALR